MTKQPEKQQDQNQMITLVIETDKYKTQATKKYLSRKPWAAIDHTKVSSVIPGVIGTIFVSEGDQIEAGQKLLILEAMKMYNHIASLVSGKVMKIYVKEGDKVVKKQLLVEIEVE